MRALVRSAVALVAGLASSWGGAAFAAERNAVDGVPAKVGRALTAPPDLLATVARLRGAALAGEREAVFALVADDVTFVGGGIAATVGRRASKRTFSPDRADEALEAIGQAFTEGEPVGPDGQAVDAREGRIGTALARIVEETEAPDWASDPLAPGGWCTRPGASWDPKAAEKAGLTGRAVFLLASTEARAKPEAGAKVVARLASGRLWPLAANDTADGWSKVALSGGRSGWLPPTSAKDAQPWGFCFLPNVEGGWLLAAVISSLN